MEWIEKYNKLEPIIDSSKSCFIVFGPCSQYERNSAPCFPVTSIVSNCG